MANEIRLLINECQGKPSTNLLVNNNESDSTHACDFSSPSSQCLNDEIEEFYLV